MSGKKNKASDRKPKTTVKTMILENFPKSRPSRQNAPKRSSKIRSGPRSFQQPNPNRSSYRSPTIRSSRSGDVAMIPGNDLVATLSVPEEKKFSAGDILVDVKINPVMLGLPRLMALSKLYKRFRVVEMVFEYEPTATIQPGSLLGFVDYDPLDDPTVGTALQRLQRARATYGEKGVNITNHGVWSVIPMKESLYIESDLVTNSHWTEYARFVIYANSDVAVGTACGSVTVRYKVEFLHPSYETPPTAVSLIQGYGWTDHYLGSEERINGTGVDGGSSLPGIAITTALSGNSNFITLPYDVVQDAKNWYSWQALVSPHEASPIFGMVGTPVGIDVFIDGRGVPTPSLPNTFSCAWGFLHVKAAYNQCGLGTGLLGMDGNTVWRIERSPHFLDMPVEVEGKEKKEEGKKNDGIVVQKSTTALDLSKVPLQRSGTMAPPTTPNGSGSSSTLSSSTVSSGWFRV